MTNLWTRVCAVAMFGVLLLSGDGWAEGYGSRSARDDIRSLGVQAYVREADSNVISFTGKFGATLGSLTALPTVGEYRVEWKGKVAVLRTSLKSRTVEVIDSRGRPTNTSSWTTTGFGLKVPEKCSLP